MIDKKIYGNFSCSNRRIESISYDNRMKKKYILIHIIHLRSYGKTTIVVKTLF